MRNTLLHKAAHFVLVCLLIANSVASYAIWNQTVSTEELSQRVQTFNNWYKSVNPKTKLEARLTPQGQVRAYALEEIKADEVYFSLERNHSICGQDVYKSKLGPWLLDLEQKYGYDEYTNLALLLLLEYSQSNSSYRAYLDILPKQPPGAAFDYWGYSKAFENEVMGMSIIRKVVDYKLLIEKKARVFQTALFEKNPNLFDLEAFNKENIEWIFMTIDSRAKTVGYELCMVPMIDIVAIRENPSNPTKIQKITSENNVAEAKAISDFAAGEQVYDNLGQSNDIYLLYQGFVLENNFHDCYNIQLTFSERKEDNLVDKRKSFFQKFFMFDRTHIDLIDECISTKNPFSRRVLFYFYTCIMEETDLEKSDPKRVNLEEDKLIVEYSRERLRAIYELFPSKIEGDKERLAQEQDPRIRSVIAYRLEQKKYLLKLIDIYNDEYNKLLKEDIL